MRRNSESRGRLRRPEVEIVVAADPTALAEMAGRRFVEVAAAAISKRGAFNVALAGGSTPAGLYRLLAQPPYREAIDWQHTYIYFGDERCVPPDHPDSNYRLARETLLDHVAVPRANIFRMAGEWPPAAAAENYAAILRSDFHLQRKQRPRFDLILLGLGADGHTASLFPGTAAALERQKLVIAAEVPAYVHPPVPRVTLTLAVLNAAREIWFLVTGAAKAEAVAAVLGKAGGRGAGRPRLPAQRVRPTEGKLIWFLDQEAAAGQIRP